MHLGEGEEFDPWHSSTNVAAFILWLMVKCSFPKVLAAFICLSFDFDLCFPNSWSRREGGAGREKLCSLSFSLFLLFKCAFEDEMAQTGGWPDGRWHLLSTTLRWTTPFFPNTAENDSLIFYFSKSSLLQHSEGFLLLLFLLLHFFFFSIQTGLIIIISMRY